MPAAGNWRGNRLGFFGLAGGGAAGADFGQFGHGKAGQAERLAAADGALEIARDELALGPLLHAADGDDADAHRGSDGHAARRA